MAEKITYILEVNDKGKVKVEGLTKGYVKLETAVKRVQLAEQERVKTTTGANAAMGDTISNAGLAGAVLTELGRTISDSNYGIRGMANNLSQLSTLLITFIGKQEQTGVRGLQAAFGGLVRQLMGPLGLILLFQTLLARLEAYSMKTEEATRKTKNLTKEFDEELKLIERLQDQFSRYSQLLETLGADGEKGLIDMTVRRLRFASTEFDRLYKLLEKNDFEFVYRPFRDGTEVVLQGDAAVKEFINRYYELIKVRREIKVVSAEEVESEEGKISRQARLNSLIDTAIKLEEDLGIKQKSRAKNTAEDIKKLDQQLEDFLNKELLSISFSDLEFNPEGLPEFIDDIEEYVDTYLLNKGQASLAQKVLGLEPATREKEIAALEKEIDERFTPILRETDEYRAALTAINKKWDKIDEETELDKRKRKFDHWNTLLRGFAMFLNNTAELNEENKDIARAAIIADAASTSIGIWKSWLVNDNTKTPAPIKVAGAIATQAAVIASTIQALRSLNTNTPIGGGATGGGTSAGGVSPTFNVVGQTQFSQLAEAISLQTGEPLRAYVVLDDVTSAEELNNKITSNSTIG